MSAALVMHVADGVDEELSIEISPEAGVAGGKLAEGLLGTVSRTGLGLEA